MHSVNIEIYGDVNKQGFMVKIWLLAPEYQLSGWIAYDKDHVLMQAQGEAEPIKAFIRDLPKKLRPHYTVRSIQVKTSELKDDPIKRTPFKILESPGELQKIRPDYTVCPDCLAEMNSPKGRRHAYPFWACKKCGPAYSSMLLAPLERKNTVFASFPPCSKCNAERKKTLDLHHAGSDFLNCPHCGPHAFLLDHEYNIVNDSNCFCEARKILYGNSILALQTLYGGFLLLCNSTSAETIQKLRKRKKIVDAPLTVIAKDMDAAERLCEISPQEKELLLSEAAPVVLVKLRSDHPADFPADLVAPDGNIIPLCLPQTAPEGLLLSHEGTGSNVKPFDYLISYLDYELELTLDELFERLQDTADYYLCHDLRIGSECLPSKAAVHNGETKLLCRSRGYVPTPLNLITPLQRSAAAFGSDINSTVAIGTGKQIIASQYLGDIRNNRGAEQLTGLLEHLFILFNMAPDVIVCDMNPELHTSAEAARFADQFAIPLILVQNHHAQALTCMAEHGLQHAMALVFDNGAAGPDGNFWGAELLDVQIEQFKRLATFAPEILPGGHTGSFRPVRQLAGRMISAGVPLTEQFLKQWNITEEEAAIWHKICREQNGRYITTHAAMRLFDSVSATLGLAPDFCSYRGQAAVRLHHAASKINVVPHDIPEMIREKFAWSIPESTDGLLTVDWKEMFRRLTAAAPTQEEIPYHALAFHDAVAAAACEMVSRSAEKTDTRDVVLSGSLFCNEILADLTKHKLENAGFRVFEHKMYPATGSALCVGQLYHAGNAG